MATTGSAQPHGKVEPTGYVHPLYARSLGEFGRPRHLRSSGAWILEREIPGSHRWDAMGCYPVFACRNWSGVCADLEAAGSELVSLVLVTDPFAEGSVVELHRCFDQVRHFKDHFIADLDRPPERRVSRHHRYYARRALRQGIIVEQRDDPLRFLDEWAHLYGTLVARHGLVGIKRFSRRCFEKQLEIPGTVMFRAVKDGVALAAQVWYLQGDLAYSHLQATSPEGYELRAPYALYHEALDWLATKCSVAAMGSGPGAVRSGEDGLAEFKRGWATGTLSTYLCARVFDRVAYEELVRRSPSGGTDYFPAYRAGELI